MTDPRSLLGDTFSYREARAAGLSDPRIYGPRDAGAILALGVDARTPLGIYSAERSLVDIVRTRHLHGSDIAWEALRRWLRQPGASPAQLIETAKHFAHAEPAIRNALEVLA